MHMDSWEISAEPSAIELVKVSLPFVKGPKSWIGPVQKTQLGWLLITTSNVATYPSYTCFWRARTLLFMTWPALHWLLGLAWTWFWDWTGMKVVKSLDIEPLVHTEGHQLPVDPSHDASAQLPHCHGVLLPLLWGKTFKIDKIQNQNNLWPRVRLLDIYRPQRSPMPSPVFESQQKSS